MHALDTPKRYQSSLIASYIRKRAFVPIKFYGRLCDCEKRQILMHFSTAAQSAASVARIS